MDKEPSSYAGRGRRAAQSLGAMQRSLAAIVGCAFGLGACASTSASLEVPVDVVATVSKLRYTGWAFDYCEGEESADPGTACVSHGGEIHKATLSDVRTPDGKRIASRLIVGFPIHAPAKDFSVRARLHLVKSANDLQKDTGIDYVAIHWEHR
jgi:hypothetical protein